MSAPTGQYLNRVRVKRVETRAGHFKLVRVDSPELYS